MERKYQVFVSSTYEDLKYEREQVVRAVLEMGHIPVGMEMFSAADEEQWKIIQRQIEASDYYIAVVAHRYGSVTSEGISYTEKEYDYAASVGVPVLGFVLDEKAPWPSDKMESATKSKRSIEKFRSKVQSRLVNFWINKEDLHAKVSISLMKAINTNPRVGWVKASETTGPEVIRELTRLSGENSSLRIELEVLKRQRDEKVDEVRQVSQILLNNSFKINVRKTVDWKSSERYETTLFDIFSAVAPNLLDENSALGMAQNMALALAGIGYYSKWPIGKNIVSERTADLAALDLIEPSRKKHSVHDKEAYWTLTKLGRQVLKLSRRIILEKGLASEKSPANES
ncbi:MAG: DUF4062 domain-containing protein [Thermodesulfobacteriota bacterium]|nr:DUF4062 domain-containing protein [Thermodesulfobacteriota bacterium]